LKRWLASSNGVGSLNSASRPARLGCAGTTLAYTLR
jgi:hypothetical protein